MSKRRRTSSIASSRGHEEDSLDSTEASTSSGPTMRKRKKHFDPMEVCHQLYDILRNHKKSDGSYLCDSFIRVPKRRQEPKYYDVVTNPIDLLKVQQKLKMDEYADVEALEADIELIVHNTKAFYKRNTQEYRDATELWSVFQSNKSRLLHVEEEIKKPPANHRLSRPAIRKTPTKTTSTPNHNNRNNSFRSSNNDVSNMSFDDDDKAQYEELFKAVMTATDENKRLLHTQFQLLPSKSKYPEYYEVIEQPIDLKRIAIKIKNDAYISILGLERDLLMMCKNACLFNEPSSQIYKNAKALKKVIQLKRIEIMENSSHPSPVTTTTPTSANNKQGSAKSRNRKPKNYTNIAAALKDVDSDPEVEVVERTNDDDACPDPNNPQWKLFETVKKIKGLDGVPLSEPFWKLPSRKFFPDYYREIKNPMSLAQIERKLSKKEYGTLSEVAGDLTVMFENAKKYNIEASKLYKDAVKLQKLMQAKVQELLDLDQLSDTDADTPARRKPGPKPKNLTPGHTPTRGRPPKDSIPMKKKLHSLAKYMLDYTCEDGRKPMLAFMEKPSKKLYSEYYELIAEPIDFLEIEAKIKAEQYSCERDMVKDFQLMFSNCRQFNEENSPIYDDANRLEKHLLDKVSRLLHTPEKEVKKERTTVRVYKPRRQITPLEKNLKSVYDAIRDYREPKANRQLSQIFMKLPSKIEYPDYYEVIKNPIDMERIYQKLKSNGYTDIEDLVSDFVLMFDNACKYNEPDSQIYKDALVLQRVCMQTKLQLKEQDDNTVPDVQTAVHDILLTLFTMVYNHQDDEGRCYSDSMAELPEHDEIDGKKVRGVSLDLLKRRLDKGLYRRLDTFQEDFFACLARARRLSRTDSQIFEDSIELQTYFIKHRDELCKNGELFNSPALHYTLADAKLAVEKLKQCKTLQESLEDETETRSSDDSSTISVIATKEGQNVAGVNDGESMTCNQLTFKVGEFVYLEAKEKGCEPHIVCIERLWENNGKQMLYGNHYLRPAETYHVSTRKFLEKEVFKSDKHITVPLENVKDRCCVVNVKQYFTMRPEGIEEKDVYVCESRYSSRGRCFKKIKIYPENQSIKLVPREVPLEPKRVMSVFRERVEKHKDELAELQDLEKLVEADKPNVVAHLTMEIDDGNTYYEQYNTVCSGVVKTGDFVYVVADGGRQIIAQIDSIWDTKDEKCYFRGPWFITPQDVPNTQNRLFYKNEVLLSTLEDVNPMVSIMGKCTVLEYVDYVSYRPTEIPEQDVYICTTMYDEINRQMKKLAPEGLRKYVHRPEVTEDEIYFFPRLLNPPKIGPLLSKALIREKILKKIQNSNVATNGLVLTKMSDMDVTMDDSLDGGPPSVGSGEIPVVVPQLGAGTSGGGGGAGGGSCSNSAASTPVPTPTPTATKKVSKKTNKTKVVTGYILYSREVRKQVVQNNPESTFGDISRIVGSEWKSLPSNEKQHWEERASKLNEETKALLLLEEPGGSPAPSTPAPPPVPPVDQVFECCWDTCDYQFEELSDCLEHTVKDSKESQGHVQAYFQERQGAEMRCMWRNCMRNNKKNLQPFPNITRLIRHVRDMHINKGNGRSVPPENRSKNFKPSSKPAAVSRPTPSATPNNPPATTSTAAPVVPQKILEPMFISVPPRPQRVLHSEAYIKYIEGLQAEQKHITQWERTLTVTPETCPPPDMEKLQNVTTWLGKRADQHDNVVAALWALRNQLLKDTLNLHKTL